MEVSWICRFRELVEEPRSKSFEQSTGPYSLLAVSAPRQHWDKIGRVAMPDRRPISFLYISEFSHNHFCENSEKQ
jgi:hypothetical protein